MRASAVASEAYRNFRTGTTHGALFASALATLTLLLGAVDSATISALVDEARRFRSEGGSVWVVDASGSVSTSACERLVEVDGIVSAGSIRASEPVVASATPSSSIRQFSVSPGFADLLRSERSVDSGALIAESVAVRYGIREGDTLSLTGPDIHIAGIYLDEKRPLIEYSVLTLADSPEADQCWLEVWPSAPTTPRVALAVVSPSYLGEVEIIQLNSSLGNSYTGREFFDGRLTRWAVWIALLLGVVLGGLSVRVRRLEMAMARHLGVPRPAQIAQVAMESMAWALGGALVGSVLAVSASRSIGAAVSDVFVLRVASASVAGAVAGALVAVSALRESLSYELFKSR